VVGLADWIKPEFIPDAVICMADLAGYFREMMLENGQAKVA
jgi:hypothetical protein